jgi:L-asparaginase
MAIRIFVTGGTIDGIDHDSEGNAPNGKKTLVPDALLQSHTSMDYSIETLFFMDSRLIDDSDRALIIKKCLECKEDRIIITHGTFSMAQTAKELGKNVEGKTIVLTGSAIPLGRENSDAHFNLGFAFAAAQLLPHGVYVAMNGRVFSHDNVRKNILSGLFEELK